MKQDRRIYVYNGWEQEKAPPLIGTLDAETLRGKEVFSFEYTQTWLNSEHNVFFDPDLYLYRGRHYAQDSKRLFGVFADSCPNRWGRQLLSRKESIDAREEGRAPRKLLESDYLLGIQDTSRMGALRFKENPEGPFLAVDAPDAIPIWTSIRELEQAAYFIDQEDSSQEEEKRWLRMLLSPGSSLGGARPKATVQDSKGNLWIAKFPSRHDEYDMGAWEMVTHELAAICGLRVPEARCEVYSKNGSTFLAKRFDRTPEKRRIHFISAMTALGKTDGDNSYDGVSYLDIAQHIQQYGSKPTEDLIELWKRIVFSILVTNTDDHLRNHGFLFDGKGLRLSPLYDVNPNPEGAGLSLNIDEYNNSLDIDVAIDAAPYFGLKRDKAMMLAKEMKEKTKQWKHLAEAFHIPRSNIERMSVSFKM